MTASNGSASRPLRLTSRRRLTGCNVHHHRSVFVQEVQLGNWCGLHLDDLGPEFRDRFLERFGDLDCLDPAGCVPPRARRLLEQNAKLETAWLIAILALERFAACNLRLLQTPRFGKIGPRGPDPDRVDFIWASPAAWVSRSAVDTALVGIAELLPEELRPTAHAQMEDFETGFGKLRRRTLRRQWAPNTSVLASAAVRQGIAFEILAGNYLRLGDGAKQQILSESALGWTLPAGSGSLEFLTPPSMPRKRMHHLLVVRGRLVSALRMEAPRIIGDGCSTVRQLIEGLNQDPLRNAVGVRRIDPDAVLDATPLRDGVGAGTVLQKRRRLALGGATTLETGALPVDVLDSVHPLTRASVLDEAVRLGADVVSIDLFCTSVARPIRKGRDFLGGRPRPRLWMHALPHLRRSAQVQRALLQSVVPTVENANIASAVVLGSKGTGVLTRDVDRYLRSCGGRVGLANHQRTSIQGRPIDHTSVGRPGRPDTLLRDPRVAVLVHATSPRRLRRLGLRLTRCSAAAILNPSSADDASDYRQALEVCIAANDGDFIVASDHPHLSELVERAGSERVILVAMNPRAVAVRRHRQAGGRVIVHRRKGTLDFVELVGPDSRLATVQLGALPGRAHVEDPKRLRRTLFTIALGIALGSADENETGSLRHEVWELPTTA